MNKKMGWPQKVSPEEKMAIVSQYYISCAGETATVIGTHGIYRKLADFAKSRGYELEAYDFSRDDAVRARIAKLTAPTAENSVNAVIPTYVPLDITALMNKSQGRIEETLQERERYFQSLHIAAAQAIESNLHLSQKVHSLQSQLQSSKEDNKNHEEEITELKQQLRSAEKDVAYLKRVIRKDVEPERAQQFLQGLTLQADIIDVVEKTVTSNISTLCEEDRQMREDVGENIDEADLSNLLKLYK